MTPAGAAVSPGWLRPLVPVAACVFLISAVAHVRVPLLPDIGADLDMSASQLGVAVALFGLGRLALDLPAGTLADRTAPLRMMAASALAMALASAVLALAAVPAVVLVSFVLLGAASAAANTTGMTSLAGSAPAHRRGSAMALYSSCLLCGQAVGPALSGAVAALGSWRYASALGAALAVIVAAVAFAWARPAPDGHGSPPARSRPTGAPITRVELAATYGVGFSVFFTVGAMPNTLLPLIGAGELDLDVSAIGLALGLGGLARLVSAVVTGAVSDRVSRRAALLPTQAVQVLGVLLLAVDAGTSSWLAAIVLMSLGSSAHAVAATILADRVDPADLGRTLGRYRFLADTGLVAGPVLSAWVYESQGRTAAVTMVATILAVTAVCSVRAVRRHGD